MNEDLFKPKDSKASSLHDDVQEALGLLHSETADEIIGEQRGEYRLLIEGTRSVMSMLWMLMKSFGLQETERSLKGFTQGMAVVLTLVHYAYALGVREGTGDG